jgi:anthranilate synthase/phosphoribosyltransferase
MIVVIDNYDSFTYNIVQALNALGAEVKVYRNDAIDLDELEEQSPGGIVISPGPGGPESGGISVDAVRRFHGKVPVLGVCLGHQCIAYAFGARITSAKAIMHGKTSPVFHDKTGIFAAVENPFNATRYHSLAVEWDFGPEDIEVCAWTSDGEIMGIRHKTKPVFGVQFHPESVMTEFGMRIFENFLSIVKRGKRPARYFVNLKEAISILHTGKDLRATEMEDAMNMIMSGECTSTQIGSFLTALSMKGETPEEIAAAVNVMRDKAIRIKPEATDVLDTCGTGGDRSGTFNVSTTVAFVAAGSGACVAKHGNRSVTSKAGSADVLEVLGANLDLPSELVEKCLNHVGVTFMFAPKFHLAMKFAIQPRREIGIRPLSNPAGANRQVVGVYSEELGEVYAKVMRELAIRKAIIAHGTDGLDEISICAPTFIWEVEGGKIDKYLFDPRSLGFEYSKRDEIKGGDGEQNGKMLRSILNGDEGPAHDMVILNAAFALYCVGRAKSLKEGVDMAKQSIQSGQAKEKLDRFLEYFGKKG